MCREAAPERGSNPAVLQGRLLYFGVHICPFLFKPANFFVAGLAVKFAPERDVVGRKRAFGAKGWLAIPEIFLSKGAYFDVAELLGLCHGS
jgi:hypothetical protein